MGIPIKTFRTAKLKDLPFGVGVTEDGFTFVVGTVELWFPGLLVGVELYPGVGTVLQFEGVGLTVTVTEETVVVGVGLMLREEVGITVDVALGLGVGTLEMVDEVLVTLVLLFPCTGKINNYSRLKKTQ